MTLQEAIIARRSTREFLDKPIPDSLIEELLQELVSCLYL